MIEELKIGAMNVNSAQIFFRKSFNKAVVTASDRVDIQLAALETSTNCLVLTGAPIVSPETLQRASELEVPILGVHTDTLTTVGIIENSLGRVRLHEGIKVKCIQEMMDQHFNFDRLLDLLQIEPK
jgi:BioD-like phosphotransacetylase family protein